MPTISFKVSPEEARAIRRRARAAKSSVSSYLRAVALVDKPTRSRRRRLVRHPVSGLLVDATPGPPVTPEQIKEALADFP
jgi:hypothetical protein